MLKRPAFFTLVCIVGLLFTSCERLKIGEVTADPGRFQNKEITVAGRVTSLSVGALGTGLGRNGINIATFHVGREAAGGNAIALIEIDGELPPDVLEKVKALPQVQSARPLKF
jgi:hypothetical protein